MDRAAFVRLIPKAELHVHIEGTIEPEMAFSIAERNNVVLPYASPGELREKYNFTDLQSFLDIYYSVTAALITEADFAEIADAYLARAAADGVRHVEIFFDPQAHTSRGVAIDTVINGLYGATRNSLAQHGLTALLIMCFLRDETAASAMQTLESAMGHVGKFIGVGLDSGEVDNPPAKFAQVFQRARQVGLHVVAHAGEEGPPEYVWQAIRILNVERIDHGVRAVEDPALIRYLVQNEIPLTVCPLSNVKLRVYDSMSEHCLPELLATGVTVSINSDDPAFFGGYIGENYEAAQRHLNLDDRQLFQLAVNSFQSSFVSQTARNEHVEAVREFFHVMARH
jgi:adenosine deaminase